MIRHVRRFFGYFRAQREFDAALTELASGDISETLRAAGIRGKLTAERHPVALWLALRGFTDVRVLDMIEAKRNGHDVWNYPPTQLAVFLGECEDGKHPGVLE